MAPAEDNDGELFLQPRGGLFPEAQWTHTTCLLVSLVRLRGQWREAEEFVDLCLMVQATESADFILDMETGTEQNDGKV